MSKQNYTIEQNNITSGKLDDEFENLENIMLSVFRLLKEYDRLVEMAEMEMEKIGGEKLDDRRM
jgi:hypothetical protein